jgi:hypothetical protein
MYAVCTPLIACIFFGTSICRPLPLDSENGTAHYALSWLWDILPKYTAAYSLSVYTPTIVYLSVLYATDRMDDTDEHNTMLKLHATDIIMDESGARFQVTARLNSAPSGRDIQQRSHLINSCYNPFKITGAIIRISDPWVGPTLLCW